MRKVVAPLLALALASCAVPVAPVPADPSDQVPPPFGAVLRMVGPEGELCSAVAILPDVALTAAHCVEGDWVLEAVLLAPSGEVRSVIAALPATLEGEDGATPDIAVLQLDAPLSAYAQVGPVPERGARTVVAGYGCPPQGELGIRPAVFGRPLFHYGPGTYGFAGVVCAGDSGGAHFDAHGRVVGVNTQRAVNGDPRGVMVVAGAATAELEKLLGAVATAEPDADAGVED